MVYSYLFALDAHVQSQGDPRVLAYPFMNSMWPNVAFCFSYLFLILAGRRFMSSRPALLVPRSFVIFYNALMVVVNAFMFAEIIRFAWLRGHSLRCADVDASPTPESERLVRAGFLFWFVKIVEFIDTFLFVLRKKEAHVSFLHVFHHFAVPLSLWFAIKIAPGGHGVLFATLNTLVHTLMYSYYGLAAALTAEARTKYLWWKVWLTRLQIVQFVVTCLHSTQMLFDNSCRYPLFFAYLLNFYSFLFFLLFADYYRKSYLKSREEAAAGKGSKSMNWIGVAGSKTIKTQ